MRSQPLKTNPGAPSVHVSVATFCVPAIKKVSVCGGLDEPSLRIHWYVTMPAPFAVIVPSNVNVSGHVVLEVGATLAVTFVTANGGKVGVNVGVGVKVGV